MTDFTRYSGPEGPNRPDHGSPDATRARPDASITSSGVCLTHTPARDAERRAAAAAGIAAWWKRHFATAVVALLVFSLGGCAAANLASLAVSVTATVGDLELPDFSRARPSPPQEPIAPTCMAGYVSIRSGLGWRCAEVTR